MFFLHFLVQLVLPKPGRAKQEKVPTSRGSDSKLDTEPVVHHFDDAGNYLQVRKFSNFQTI
jgi:hypothetical protein